MLFIMLVQCNAAATTMSLRMEGRDLLQLHYASDRDSGLFGSPHPPHEGYRSSPAAKYGTPNSRAYQVLDNILRQLVAGPSFLRIESANTTILFAAHAYGTLSAGCIYQAMRLCGFRKSGIKLWELGVLVRNHLWAPVS